MEAGHATFHQFAALVHAPFVAYNGGIGVALALQQLVGELAGQVGVEGLGQYVYLRHAVYGLYSRDDGDGDAHFACFLYEGEVFFVVEEHLCDGIFGTVVGLFLQPIEIGLEVGRFYVLFGIACHTILESFASFASGGTVDEQSVVIFIYLLLQLHSVVVAAKGGGERLFVLGLVATQQQQVGYAR